MRSIFIMVVSLGFLFEVAVGQAIEGSWSGVFMDQFDMEVVFLKKSEKVYSGQLKMFSQGVIIQDDMLTDIYAGPDSMEFKIPAKQTDFLGLISPDGGNITGAFVFPDGSRHPVKLSKGALRSGPLQKFSSLGDFYEKDLSLPELIEDYNLLYNKILEVHPYLKDSAFRERLGRIRSKLDRDLDQDMSLMEFYKKTSLLTDALQCGHTGVRMPADYYNLLDDDRVYLPLKVFIIGDKLYFSGESAVKTAMEAGAEILEINGEGAGKIINQLGINIPADLGNINTKRILLERSFNDWYTIYHPSPAFRVKYKVSGVESGEIIRELTIPATTRSYYYENTANSGNAQPVSFSASEDDKTGYMRIESFGIRNVNLYVALLDSLFARMDSIGFNALILDLRGNEGGHPIFAAQLLSYFVKEDFIYFEGPPAGEDLMPLYNEMHPNPNHFGGKLYVLIDGACQSTTGHLISLLDDKELAEFIGSTPGSTYYCNDHSIRLQLPHTGIEANIATTPFVTSVSEKYKTRPFKVDHPVNSTIKERVRGDDPVLRLAESLAGN